MVLVIHVMLVVSVVLPLLWFMPGLYMPVVIMVMLVVSVVLPLLWFMLGP